MLPPALEERTPSPPRLPRNKVSLSSGIYEKADVRHNKRVVKQENIAYPSPILRPSEPSPGFSTTLNIDWDLVNRQREKNDQLIGDFLQKRAEREILRCQGLRSDKRRTATSIPLDSVKPVPGATYFKPEGNGLKVDIERGVKWSKTRCKWVAKTMFAGTKFTLGYFTDRSLAEHAYLEAVEAKKDGKIKSHLQRIGAEYTDALGRVQIQQRRGRGRPRKHAITQGQTLWGRQKSPSPTRPQYPMLPLRATAIPKQFAQPWSEKDAAKILMTFREGVMRSSGREEVVAPLNVERAASATVSAAFDAALPDLPASDMSDGTESDEDMKMFGMS